MTQEQQAQILKFVKQGAISIEKTKLGTEYYLMKKDFDATAAKIKYFAFHLKLPMVVIGISGEVPKKFRDIWVEHEVVCVPSGYSLCSKQTIDDVAAAQQILTWEQYKKFLSCRIKLFEDAIDNQPEHEHLPEMKGSLRVLRDALRHYEEQYPVKTAAKN